MATLDAHEEAVAQVALADRIVISKTGLVEEPETTMTLRRRLQSINPARRFSRGRSRDRDAFRRRSEDLGLQRMAIGRRRAGGDARSWRP